MKKIEFKKPYSWYDEKIINLNKHKGQTITVYKSIKHDSEMSIASKFYKPISKIV